MQFTTSNQLKTAKVFPFTWLLVTWLMTTWLMTTWLMTTGVTCFAQTSAPSTPQDPAAEDKSVDELINRLRREEIEALEAYLARNPQADDREEVLQHLVTQYGKLAIHYREIDTGNNSGGNRQLEVLEKQYALMVKQSNIEQKLVLENIVERFFLIWKGARSSPQDYKMAQAVFDQGKKDFSALQDDPWFRRQESKLKWPRIGDAVAIDFTALDGSKVDIATLKGKAVLIYFWQSSLPDDYNIQPALKTTYQKFHDAGFEIIGVSLDEDEVALRNFITQEEIPWPQSFDGKGYSSELASKYGIVFTPFYFVVGRDGKAAGYGHEGSELEALVSGVLK